MREAVGINEVHNFGKYLIKGTDARAWLDRIMAGRVPQAGPPIADADAVPQGPPDRRFHHLLPLGRRVPAHRLLWLAGHTTCAGSCRTLDDGVALENISDTRNGFQIAGPNAREVLQACTRSDISDMRFMDVRRLTVGMADCIVQRVSYTGDLGYEIYCDLAENQRALWEALWSAGKDLGMKPFGMRAMMSLRLDKFFGSWLREFSPDYTALKPASTASSPSRNPWISSAARRRGRTRRRPCARQLCAFEVEADDADVNAYEPIWLDSAKSWASAPPAVILTMRRNPSHWGLSPRGQPGKTWRWKSKSSARCTRHG